MKRSAKPAKPSLSANVETELRKFGAPAEGSPLMADLHRRAETQLRHRRQTRPPKAKTTAMPVAPQRLLHELQVHQVELELQNTELLEARNQTETLLEKYTDLYDFAPVGYLSLDEQGRILEANLTGAALLGMERARLLQRPLRLFVGPADRPVIQAFLKRVFTGAGKESCEVALAKADDAVCWARLHGTLATSAGGPPKRCWVAASDITVLRVAADKVRVSEIRYRRLFEAAHDGVLLLDPATRKITDANPFMTEMLGYSHDQLVGRELFEIGLLKDEAASQEMVRKLKRQHEVRYEDLPLESQAGRHQEVEVVANLYQENGHAVIQCNLRDITARKATEHELAEKARLLDLSHDAIFVRDMAGRIRYWNDGAKELYGWSRKEALGKVSNLLLRTEFPIPLEEMTEELFRSDHWTGELVHTARNGRRITVFARKTLDRDARGKPSAVLENITDISERKAAEEALRRSEALFSALVAQAPVGVYVVDARFRLQQVNPTALVQFAHIRPLLGRDFAEVVRLLWPKRVAGPLVARFRHTLKTGEPYQASEFVERRRDLGVREAYEWQIQRVTLPAGEHGVVCFFTNITGRKQAEETQRRVEVLAATNSKLELEIARRQAVELSLKRSQQLKDRLLAEAHEMQAQLRHLSRSVLRVQEDERRAISRELHDVIAQTLTGINVQLGALKKGAALNPGSLDRSIASTQLLVEQSVDIVHRFARDLRPAVLDDLGLIPALHSFMKSFTERTGVRTRLTAFAEVERVDPGRRTALFRVTQEALTNVARHAQATRVEVSLENLPEGIRLRIVDDGKSFNVERALHLTRGKRLGLLGMRERLEMVGGKLTLESTPGQGTTVTAQLPFNRAQVTPPPE